MYSPFYSPFDSLQDPYQPPPLPELYPSMMMETPNQESTAPTPTSNSPQADTPGSKDPQRNIAPAACIGCRAKHLKCDGLVPCTRCRTNDLECTWVKSRRGFRRRPAKPSNGQNTAIGSPRTIQPVASGDAGWCNLPAIPPATPETGLQQRILPGNGELALILPEAGDRTVALDQGTASPRALGPALRERCLEAYFHYFSQAHPFLLPKSYLWDILRTRPLARLEAAMRYIGSFYIKDVSTEYISQEVQNLLSSKDCARDAFTVQALLLFSIGLDGNNQLKRASELLVQAQDLALEIGMQQREFAVVNGEGSAVMEESWRRTWWELYIIDGMVAGVHQSSSFRFFDIPSTVLLPCEEQEYVSGRIPTPHSIDEFDDQSFSDEIVFFSSFAYRIAAIRNLGRILNLQHIPFHDDPIIDHTDAHLVNWHLHLPDSKKLAVDTSGQSDEMLFQAQMITQASTVLLHRPFSQLDTTVARNVTSCAPYTPVAGGEIYNIHAGKIISAASEISKLVTLPVPLSRHTHFFTCVLTLSSIVHLSCWAALLPLSQDENLKQQIRLNTGALKSLSEIWPSATRVGNQVKGVAQAVFASRKAASQEGWWGSFTDEEVMRSLVEDEGFIQGI